MLPRTNFWIWSIVIIVINFSICQSMPYAHFITGGVRYKRNTLQCLPGTVVDPTGMRVFLTVSSLATTTNGTVTERQLELNWYNNDTMPGDLVGLYDHDPLTNPTNPLVSISAIDYPDKFYVTPYMLPRPDMSTLTMERQCLGYWIGYVRGGQTIASNCIKVQPNWMWENRAQIGPIKYIDMMIPGAHDAGSYRKYNGSLSNNIFHRWMITQEEDFYEQLMFGIRHFDLRLAYYSDTDEKFWINHSVFQVNPFSVLIEACKRFLNSTKEILLLDFHQFPVGFDGRPERHGQLIMYIMQELGAYMLSPSVGYDVTMDTIWRSDKRLIVTYSNGAQSNSPLLWRGIPQIWANTMDPNYLKIYIDNEMNKGYTSIWSAQLELTPTATDVIFTTSSLRILADQVNRNVTEWCRDLWWDQANVVALDFVLGSNIIEVAIESNLKRRTCIDRMIEMRTQSRWPWSRGGG